MLMLPTIRELTTQLVRTLSSTIRPLEQRWFEAELLIGHCLTRDRTWIALHPNIKLTQKQLTTISKLAERRAMHEPLAYLFQEAPFCERTFFVDKRVLIPRAESEWLVQRGLELIQTGKDWIVWDVGTGSGCLALSFALSAPLLTVTGSDSSVGAISVARKNTKRLQAKNCRFTSGPYLTSTVSRSLKRSKEKHWLIVANLPYLPEADAANMQKQVLNYEPSLALFAEEGGLKKIKELLIQLRPLLLKRTGDVVFLEHDPRQAYKLKTYAKTLLPSATIATEKDQNNASRFTTIKT